MSATPQSVVAGPERTAISPNRLLIVRLSAMGDVVHSLPAVAALRRAFPTTTIGWLIEERWVELLAAPGAARRGERTPQKPLVDNVHTVRLKEWRRSLLSRQTTRQIATVWNEVRAAGYDVALDLQGAIRSAVLAQWSKAPVVYGAAEPWERPAAWLYNQKITTRGQHVVEQWHSLAEAVADRKLAIESAELPHSAQAEESVGSRLNAMKIDDFAVLNPGAGWGAKQWPAERYGAVARQLGKAGLRSIVNYGPGEEHLADVVQRDSGGAAYPMQGSISELIALSRRAKLFVGGDTGPMHVAAALKVPVVALFGPTDPSRNGPYGTSNIVLRDAASVTSHARHAGPDPGLMKIQPEDVVQAAEKLLSRE
jgi:heptosyltransferase I